MKLSILIVNDDPNLITGLKSNFSLQKRDWNLIFVGEETEAVSKLEIEKIDVIIADISLHRLDGTKLLKKVKDKYPHIIRIVLSGYANDHLALRHSRIVHQSIAKPTTPESIINTIEKANKLRNHLHDSELLSLINTIDVLPSLPEIYLKLEEEINAKSSSIEKLGNIISTDPAITTKILHLANSAFFGLPQRISNITQALNFLGINIIQNLVLTIKLFKALDTRTPNAAIYQNLWNHSNKVAFMAKQLANSVNLSKTDNEDTYLGGLLHDIGKIILLEKIEGIKIGADLSFKEYEDRFTNITHADIGAYLLGLWGIPDSIVEAVAYHHSSENISINNFSPSTLVKLANKIVHKSDLHIEDINKKKIEQLINDYGNE